ncbi:Rossmann-like and DUF2520 domain-containing protein [Petrimonas sp.]|uniref:Rossmann-like and DUF2520 domain-containing protein n=1 Tax=Petrimonas sp. TaxID=2023866 RepID=UPI003F51A239
MKIAFIGTGNVSTALGLYFKTKGFEIQGYYSRNHQSAEKAAQLTHSHPYISPEELINDSQMIWITTPDDQIEKVARQLSELPVPQKNEKLILHASGVHSLEILNPLKDKGYQTACAHPLLAFSNPVLAQQKLNNVWFGIEKTDEENQQLTDFFNTCGNKTLSIDSDKKTLYHAAACVLSNYLVTLLNASYRMFEKSGVAKDDIQKATTPLLESVIDNLKDKNCADALTGPIKRGDEKTVSMHVESLSAFMPEMLELYTLMGKETLKMLASALNRI